MSNRRTATDQDLAVDTIVYKGSGKVEYRIWKIRPAGAGVTATGDAAPIAYCLQKVGSKSAPTSRAYGAEDLQIEVQTGREMLADLLKLN